MIASRTSTNTKTTRANAPAAAGPAAVELERRSLWIEVPDETCGLDLIARDPAQRDGLRRAGELARAGIDDASQEAG